MASNTPANSSSLSNAEAKRAAARDTLDILEELSVLLVIDEVDLIMLILKCTGLDRTQLTYCVSMIENGINPEALATVIMDLRQQAAVPAGR